ncbi:hypothetical protein [Limosilactobacillus reuteri]|uniref:hypothetical protein n=1 Tax=Limosilactobacillus reuteri TaxID=1598 RepID=UPI001E478721|nr:hypothetical protein [Limosilactobacillus reuteri]MCC4501337.1 hypothetical protein [Limosilactobacillus reuteri]
MKNYTLIKAELYNNDVVSIKYNYFVRKSDADDYIRLDLFNTFVNANERVIDLHAEKYYASITIDTHRSISWHVVNGKRGKDDYVAYKKWW